MLVESRANVEPELLHLTRDGWMPDNERLPVLPSPAAIERMQNLPFPNSDPVFGSGGPMTKIWNFEVSYGLLCLHQIAT